MPSFLRSSLRRSLPSPISENTIEHSKHPRAHGAALKLKRVLSIRALKRDRLFSRFHARAKPACRALPGLGAAKTSLEILSKAASTLPGPVQAVVEAGLLIVKYTEVRVL